MDIVKSEDKRPALTAGQNVGVITNYLTEQLITKEFRTFSLPARNYMKIIEKNNIKVVFLEWNIYEVDHPWFNKERKELVEKLNELNVSIVIVKDSNEVVPVVLERYFQIEIDHSIKDTKNENNKMISPFLYDHEKFNPAYHENNIDIVYFKLGDFLQCEEFTIFHQKFKPNIKEVSIKKISREFLERFIKIIKDAKVLYIYYSEELELPFLKQLEVIAALHNTIVLTEQQLGSEFKYSTLEKDKETTVDYMRTLLKNKIFRDKIVIKRNREAMLDHTLVLKHSPYQCLINPSDHITEQNSKVDISVIIATKRKAFLHSLIEDINVQQHVNLQLILLTHGYELTESEKLDLKAQSNFELIITSEGEHVSFGNCLNKCMGYIKYDYVIKLDDDDYYFPNFLIDIWLGLKYSGATLAGKNAFFFYLESENLVGQRRLDFQFKEVREIKGNTLLCRTSTIKNYGFGDLYRHVDSDFIRRIREDGGFIYSIHPYDMCVYRAADKIGHTFQAEDTRFLRDAEVLYYGKPNRTVAT